MLLAGDVGGTKTLLGLFSGDTERPVPGEVGEFVTLDYGGLEEIVREFLTVRGVKTGDIAAASFGVAGAVTEGVARLTNVPWLVDETHLRDQLGLRRVVLMNDLEAFGHAVPVLDQDETAVLQQGITQPQGNAAVIAAGTGLGEALLHNMDGRFVPIASEGGHADYAARTPRELQMADALSRVFGRVSVEHVVSGPGIVNVYQFTHQSFGAEPAVPSGDLYPSHLCAALGVVRDPGDLPARISEAGLNGRCSRCAEAMQLFMAAYGAEAGNLALRYVATGGVYVGGGIAPKMLKALESGPFLEAFRAKGVMADLVATIPVAVILNPDAGLLGAAVRAGSAARS
jgi:glucokinase